MQFIWRTQSQKESRFNTASGMDCMQFAFLSDRILFRGVSIPQAVWIACNLHFAVLCTRSMQFQYRKRYGLHAIAPSLRRGTDFAWFQYRKRYGLHAMEEKVGEAAEWNVSIPQAVWIACNNTFMRCWRQMPLFQYRKRYGLHAIMRFRPLREGRSMFQYRKRYGLHAMTLSGQEGHIRPSFNTASGMDCMQWESLRSGKRLRYVSIPQAVWIACNREADAGD